MDKKLFFSRWKAAQIKGPDGYRPDTMPMVEALKQRGQDAEVLFFDITKSRKSFTT